MILWIDASAGISGDMLLGALIDVGADIELVQAEVDLLNLSVRLVPEAVQRGGLRATRVHVQLPTAGELRHLPDIMRLLGKLTPEIRNTAGAIFERLALAEAKIHGTTPELVHFHEVGALDAIADVVAVAACLHLLGSPTVHASPVALGSGRAATEHGDIPVPAPAVLELLREGQAFGGSAPFESATPTGAAILAHIVQGWGPMPLMSPTGTGVGAGARDPQGWPNVVRVISGTAVSFPDSAWQLEANIDDLDPRLWPEVQSCLMRAGASDAWITPILMKKGRPAHLLSVLTAEDRLEAVRLSIYEQTSTIGLRESQVRKSVLDRTERAVDVEGHAISVKIASLHGRVMNVSVEWEDALRAARHLGQPAKLVLDKAKAVASQQYVPPASSSDP